MKVQQLAVFIENKAGRVSEVADLLGEAGVNIRGFSVSDTADYGIMRLIVDDPAEAQQALKDAGFTVREDEVICVAPARRARGSRQGAARSSPMPGSTSSTSTRSWARTSCSTYRMPTGRSSFWRASP